MLLVALALAFGFGVTRLFQLRFEAGDLYPPYSSLRADPLGTRAFFESLKGVKGLSIQRFTSSLNQLSDGRNATLLVLGGAPLAMYESAEDEYTKLERFMSEGGRIVVSLSTVNSRPLGAEHNEFPIAKKQREKKNKETQAKKKPGPEPSEESKKSSAPDKSDADSSQPRSRPQEDTDQVPGEKMISLKERWGVDFGYAELPKDKDGEFLSVQAKNQSGFDLPRSVLWHTALYFDNPPTNWNVIYSREKHPVIIERRFGRGSLAFLADSYLLSNEALLKTRYPQLLSWVVGPNVHVIFDETHLGVIEEPGVAALIRRYRLHGFVAGLLLIAALHVWKNMSGFNPARTVSGGQFSPDSILGKDSLTGFVNLLRRGIPPADVLLYCFSEWQKARTPGALNAKSRVERATEVITAEKLMPPSRRNPVEGYRRIRQILAERS